MKNNLILVLNCGSSSIKFSIFNIYNIENIYLHGKFDLINTEKSIIYINFNKKNKKYLINKKLNYEDSINLLLKDILNKEFKLYKNIIGVGHRIVHGGKFFKNSVIINNEVINNIEKLIKFSPIHNYINVIGIKKSIEIFSNIKNNNIAVFDTSFYYDLPINSYLYAIPYYMYKNYDIRRYGAHGINNRYILNKSSDILNININKINLIICHLGSGSSISAISKGKCIDTSMGLTPLEGLVMGTRCGDIDPYIIIYLSKELSISINEIENILINKSGILGITNNISSDLRIIEDLYNKNDKHSIIAINIYCYKIVKYIGSYFTILNGNIDAIIFTGGIGENSYIIRNIILKQIKCLKIYINDKLNKNYSLNSNYNIITTKDSKIKSLVINSNEELIIAKDTIYLLNL